MSISRTILCTIPTFQATLITYSEIAPTLTEKNIQSLNFTTSRMSRSSAHSSLGDHFALFLSSTEGFEPAQKCSILDTFFQYHLKPENSYWETSLQCNSFFDYLLAKSFFFEYENLKTSLSFIKSLTSLVQGDAILPIDYIYEWLITEKKSPEFEIYRAFIDKYFNQMLTIQDLYKDFKKIKNYDLLYHELQACAKQLRTVRLKTKDSSGHEYLICTAISIFSSFYDLLALLIENPSPSAASLGFSEKLSDLINIIALDFIGFLGVSKNPSFFTELKTTFSDDNVLNFQKLTLKDYFPVTEFVFFNRRTMCMRLKQIMIKSMKGYNDPYIPDISLEKLKNLINFILAKFEYREKRRYMLDWALVDNDPSYISEEDYNYYYVDGLRRLTATETAMLSDLQEKIDLALEKSKNKESKC